MLRTPESFYLQEVENGNLKVRKNGIIINTRTGYSSWATGSGKYPKISKLDMLDQKIKHIQCHRLMWLVHKGKIPEDRQINHKNGDKKDYRLRNLELVTPLENMRHALKMGLMKGRLGVKNGNSKFTYEDVIEIKKRIAKGEQTKRIAADFGVSRSPIDDIRNNKRY